MSVGRVFFSDLRKGGRNLRTEWVNYGHPGPLGPAKDHEETEGEVQPVKVTAAPKKPPEANPAHHIPLKWNPKQNIR